MAKWGLVGIVVTLSAALAIRAWGQAAPAAPLHNTHELSGLMRAKLASSQKVVEGLMAADFELIHKGALDMSKICDATNWHASDDQVYAHYRAELKRTAKKLMLQVEDKNLDAASYTYMHSLTTCISCHEYSRDVLHIASRNADLKVVPIPTTEEGESSNRSRTLRR